MYAGASDGGVQQVAVDEPAAEDGGIEERGLLLQMPDKRAYGEELHSGAAAHMQVL